jgi:Zn-dependent protease
LAECEICGREEVLPFDCPYCGGIFCSDHRLPENHNCRRLWMAQPPSKKTAYTRDSGPGLERRPVSRLPARRAWVSPFSQTELKHLLAGLALVLVAGLSFVYSFPPLLIGGAVLIFAAAFLLHELAHKFSAQRHGLWAEFRISPLGALLTLVTALPFIFFKIIAPGAVVVAGFMVDRSVMGRVAVVGPLTNLVMGGLLLALTSVFPYPWSLVFRYGAYINGLIAFFNLLPFGIMDGYKVIQWSKAFWGVVFAASLALLFLAR